MTTYASGAQHCANQGKSLCCYDQYCPNGAGSAPVGDRRDGDEWAPTRDQQNWWVQVGVWSGDPVNSCVLHHELQDGIYGLPGWGLDVQSYGHQGWVLCCAQTANSCAHAASTVQALQAGNSWFEIGSAMTDYASGKQHCSASGLMLCCYDDYCPQGQGNPPVGGTRQGDEWAPARDADNWWLQVGVWGGDPTNTCVLHHELQGGVYGLPGWGTSSDSAGHQGWVMCCRTTTRTDLWQENNGVRGSVEVACAHSPARIAAG